GEEFTNALDVEANDGAQDHTGDRADNTDCRTCHKENAQDRAARRAHGAQYRDVMALVLYQHYQAGKDVQRRHQNDQRQDHEHDVASHLQGREKGLVALAPISQEYLALRSFLHFRLQRIDRIRIVDIDLDQLRPALLVEIELGFFERHVDDGAVI